MKCRASYLVAFYAATVLWFVVAKVVFMACQGEAFSAADVASVVGHGLSLDLSTALYFVLVPFLAAVVSVWLPAAAWCVVRRVLLCWHAIVAVAFALAFVADTSLYPFWHFKLDASCLQYLTTPTEAMASVSAGYLVVRFLAVVVVAAALWLSYGLLLRGPWPVLPLPRRVLSSLSAVAVVPLLVIGIRGGLGESTTNIGQVYYSQRPFLNHSAVNPVFSFLASFEETASYIPDYRFMSDAECDSLMRQLYFTGSVGVDSVLRTSRPNIVVILLESCGGIFTNDIGRRPGIMPCLDSLVHEGVYFSRFYANSWRTDRGTLCTWSGFPSFPRSSVMKMPAKTRLLPGIAKSLRAAGYHTSYLYGGDINFTNMRSYLVNTGFERLVSMSDYSRAEQSTAKWGVRDDITFSTLLSDLRAMAPGERYLFGYSTLSSHEPWDVPHAVLDDPVANAFHYVDACLGRFIAEARRLPLWDDLLVIVLPDHGYTYFGVDAGTELHDHVPMLWLGGAVRGPRRIDVLCNQTDLPATLLGQLGLSHDDYPFSRDVLSSGYRYPFAAHTYNNALTMLDSTGYAVFDLTVSRLTVGDSLTAPALIRRGQAILQSASRHLRKQ